MASQTIGRKDMEVKVSVIVPMYNVFAFAKQCVNGLLHQSLHDFEVVLVDDCSSDMTLDLINSLIESNDRDDVTFKVLHHETNQGVACARNTGLDNSEGEYVYFVDADDRIEPDTLEVMYSVAKERDADISGCEWYLTFNKNERHIHQKNVMTGKDLFDAFADGVMRWNLWLFMVKRSIYENHGFRFLPGMNMGEDMMLMMKTALVSKNVVITHRPLYHYSQTNNGAQTKNWTRKNIEQVTANEEEVERLCKALSGDFSTQIDLLKLNLKLPFIISDRKEDFDVWKNWFPEANESIRDNKSLPFRTKFIQIAADNGQFWIVKLYYWLIIKFVYGVLFK